MIPIKKVQLFFYFFFKLNFFFSGKRDLAQIHPDDPDQKSPAFRFAERMFKLMDDDGDGEITIEEFVKGFHKMKTREANTGRTTVTAMGKKI